MDENKGQMTVDGETLSRAAIIMCILLGFLISAVMSASFILISDRFGVAPAASGFFVGGMVSLKIAQKILNRWMKKRIIKSENATKVIEATSRVLEAEAILNIVKRYEKETAIAEIERRVHELNIDAKKEMSGKKVCPDCGDIHL